MNRERDLRRLREYESELREAEAEASRLRRLVTAYREVLGIAEPVPAESNAPTQRKRPPRSSAGLGARGGLIAKILALMADGQPRGAADVLEALAADPEAKGSLPARNSVGSRLNELERRGDLRKIAWGKYQAAGAANQNGAEAPGQSAPKETGDADSAIDPAEQSPATFVDMGSGP